MNVLVIGNGFDLDLGLDTRYSDFVKDSLWEELKNNVEAPEGGLAEFVFQQADNRENWFNLEDCIAEYLTTLKESQNLPNIDNDICFHKRLKDYLLQYIEEELDNKCDKLKTDTIAFKLFSLNSYDKIYSFNYTWYDSIVFPTFPNVEYVHGQWDNIVLGIGETECLNDKYSFLVKVNSPNYPKTGIAKDLLKANEVIIFGHSLCVRDAGVFIPLFNNCINGNLQDREQHITIITKDEPSIQNIKLQFSKLGYRFDLLNSLGNFSFIATDLYKQGDKKENEKAKAMMERLKKEDKSIFK